MIVPYRLVIRKPIDEINHWHSLFNFFHFDELSDIGLLKYLFASQKSDVERKKEARVMDSAFIGLFGFEM